MRAVLLGLGAVGIRAARQLAATDGLDRLVLVHHNRSALAEIAEALDDPGRVDTAFLERGASPDAVLDDADVLVLTTPTGHRAAAEVALERGVHVVSVCDAVDGVRGLLALDAEARERAVSIVVGAAFAPGLSCVLARHAAMSFDTVAEIHVSSIGTGGPDCARRHHAALSETAVDWRDGAWRRRRGGSGRELCWFPDPVGGADCYRAARPDALLLVPAFPGVKRVTARMAATRRDRLTAWMPMLRPPHPEGMLGAVRVEIRGLRGAGHDAEVYGALDRPALAAGTVASVAATWAADGRLSRPGAGGLAELIEEPVPFLQELARRGVRAAVFEGSDSEKDPPTRKVPGRTSFARLEKPGASMSAGQG
ncbi:MAG TPA: saccharopine dehydrogenase NADP-binding domain-containing protein [Acidimicrobiales bacterium]|jgi:saccharopine dehydrogenase-like NADP-dependent oxidoreductase|nr:saccharopine dehydrogenase NADP-binding domain-containing protein [Acidimicrobiales bacterium]